MGVPREIFLLGDYATYRHDFHHDGYYPGWRFWIILPWFVAGEMDFGNAAVATVMLHVAAIALVYDVLHRLLNPIRDISGSYLCTAAAWVICALIMTAQGMGLLWSYTNLVEQPQIYLGVMVLLW